MSKEIFEINSHYGEEDFRTLMKKVINLKLNLQETSNNSLNTSCGTDSDASLLIGHR